MLDELDVSYRRSMCAKFRWAVYQLLNAFALSVSICAWSGLRVCSSRIW
jgi:hypothetical protein